MLWSPQDASRRQASDKRGQHRHEREVHGDLAPAARLSAAVGSGLAWRLAQPSAAIWGAACRPCCQPFVGFEGWTWRPGLTLAVRMRLGGWPAPGPPEAGSCTRSRMLYVCSPPLPPPAPSPYGEYDRWPGPRGAPPAGLPASCGIRPSRRSTCARSGFRSRAAADCDRCKKAEASPRLCCDQTDAGPAAGFRVGCSV
jgi:hypothetical protein